MTIAARQNAGLPLLLASAILISLSGVLMPGPVFAVSIAKGRVSPWAGIRIAIGHALVEFPLMLLIYFGVATFLSGKIAQTAIGTVGGLALLWMGYGMIRTQLGQEGASDVRQGPVLAGVLTTMANPYFFLWWTTAGFLLVSRSMAYGFGGFLALAISHWLCDLGWDTTVSFMTYRSRRLWSATVHRAVFTLCGLTLVGFGAYFAISVWL